MRFLLSFCNEQTEKCKAHLTSGSGCRQYRGPEEDEGNFDVSFRRSFDVTPLSRSRDGFADPINPQGEAKREAAADAKMKLVLRQIMTN
ncbi:hypothetical protein F2P79_003799 [Pimephales promelas]|nr:hypothetical protein F2P79_003799 [Pimephales promelas]